MPFAAILSTSPSELIRFRSCVDDQQTGTFCDWVYDTTDNKWLAESSDWLLAKPTSIVLILLLAGLLRFLVHRVIRRVAAGAAEGTVPGVLAKGHAGKLLGNPLLSERRRQRAETMSLGAAQHRPPA